MIKNITRIEFFIFWCAVLIQALIWSRFLLSVSLWAIVIIALFEVPKLRNAEVSVFQWIFEYLQFWHWKLSRPFPPQYKTHIKTFLVLTLPFFTVFLSGLWSENLPYWLSRLQLRLPFLILPFVFSIIPPLSKRQLQNILVFFMVIISLNILLVLSNYVLHFQDITQNLGRGQPMPFLKEHITFSIMATFAFFCGLELWQDVSFFEKKWKKNSIAALTVFLFISLHIIAVRTGIVALYVCLILRGILFVFQSRRYLMGLLGLSILFMIPWLSYQFLPSFQQRLNYTIWDIQQYKAGVPDAKSDSERIISLKIGIQLFMENKLLGIGFGDIDQEMTRCYEQKFPNLEPKLPHNQWVLTLMGMGIMGGLVSLFSFWYPVFKQYRFKCFLFLSLHVVIFTYSMTDIPFEATFSLIFYLFFVCLFLNNRIFINYENA